MLHVKCSPSLLIERRELPHLKESQDEISQAQKIPWNQFSYMNHSNLARPPLLCTVSNWGSNNPFREFCGGREQSMQLVQRFRHNRVETHPGNRVRAVSWLISLLVHSCLWMGLKQWFQIDSLHPARSHLHELFCHNKQLRVEDLSSMNVPSYGQEAESVCPISFYPVLRGLFSVHL